MEKRRRERINNSLNELKNLLLESRKKDVSARIMLWFFGGVVIFVALLLTQG